MSILKQRIKRKTYEVDSRPAASKDQNLVSSPFGGGFGKEPKAVLNKRMEEKQKQSLAKIESKVNTGPSASLQKANPEWTLKKVNAILDTRNNLLQPSRKEIPHAACMESKVQGTLEGLNRRLKLNTNFNTFLILSGSAKNAQTFLKGKSNKNTKKKNSLEDAEGIKRETKPSDAFGNAFGNNTSLVKTSYNWVLNKVHPHHYSNILGYRYKNTIINPSITLHGVRRVLHFLKNVIKGKNAGAESNAQAKLDLIVVIESSVLNVGSQDKAQVSSASLVAYSLLRLQQFSGLKILPKTTKETIRYLTTGETINLCGVLMLNPAKSVLGSLADTLFNKKNKKLSAGNAIGTLCSKKGIPLISLCDISSPLTLCTYPIICDTRDVKSIYYVFDLLTYGLNQLTIKP